MFRLKHLTTMQLDVGYVGVRQPQACEKQKLGETLLLQTEVPRLSVKT